MPCGFCGRSGQLECTVSMIITKSSSFKIISNCPFFVTIHQYKTVEKGSASNPMRNVPIFCRLCPGDKLASKPVIWRYNYINHLRTCHPSYACPEVPLDDSQVQIRLPNNVWTDMQITETEQQAAKIPSTHTIAFFNNYEPSNANDPSEVGRKRTKEKTSKASRKKTKKT